MSWWPICHRWGRRCELEPWQKSSYCCCNLRKQTHAHKTQAHKQLCRAGVQSQFNLWSRPTIRQHVYPCKLPAANDESSRTVPVLVVRREEIVTLAKDVDVPSVGLLPVMLVRLVPVLAVRREEPAHWPKMSAPGLDHGRSRVTAVVIWGNKNMHIKHKHTNNSAEQGYSHNSVCGAGQR